MDNLQREILKTVYFFSLYDTALRKGDLLALTQYKCSENEFSEAVDSLVEDGILKIEVPFIGFAENDSQSIDDETSFIEKFEERKQFLNEYWSKVRKHAFWWQFIPFVRGVFVGNSLAMGTANEKSDIDLLVVTEKNRMFFARALFSLWVHITGNRRHSSKIRGRFCLSFWLAEDNLSFDKIELNDDPYLYYWLVTLKPVFGSEVYRELKKTNKKFFEAFPNRKDNYRKALIHENVSVSFWRGFWEKLLKITMIALLCEAIMKKYQKRRALTKYHAKGDSYGVIIDDKILKFHEKDTRKEIANKLNHYTKSIEK